MRILVTLTLIGSCLIGATWAADYPPAPGQPCLDKSTECAKHTHSVCTQYRPWAQENCAKFCGYCGIGCEDRLRDCPQYGKDACSKFPAWASYNCPNFCDMCHTQMKNEFQSGARPCVNNITNCRDFGGGELCIRKDLSQWVDANCPRYCGRCGCKDIVPNCQEFGKEICHKKRLWSIVKCGEFCQDCNLRHPEIDEIAEKISDPTPARPAKLQSLADACEDRSTECDLYAQSTCLKYPVWAQEKCAKKCGYCGCHDKISTCAEYGEAACHEPYLEWALENCPRTCNLCDVIQERKSQQVAPKCEDQARWECGKKDDKWCDAYPSVASVGCSKTCKYCDCKDTSMFCERFTKVVCPYNIGKTECAKFCGYCRDASKMTPPNPTPTLPTTTMSTTRSTTATMSTTATKQTPSPTTTPASTHQPTKPSSTKPTNSPTTAKQASANPTKETAKPSTTQGASLKPQTSPPVVVSTDGSVTSSPVESTTAEMKTTAKPQPTVPGVRFVKPTWGAATYSYAVPACTDTDTECGYVAQFCDKYDAIKLTCAKSCGLCDACLYNKKGYKKGATWSEGCRERCQCDGGDSGKVKCYPRCPTWENLPSDCKLEYVGTACCGTPTCPKGYIVQQPIPPWE